MKFVYPAFLFALFSIAIPIIIHLFNFRKFKKVYFTNVRFLKEVKQDTQSRSRLRHLLVLLCRILAITALVLAFAQPFIPADESKIVTGDKAVSIYIDNSFSMEALTTGGTLLDEAKKRAKEIAGAFKATDRFQLLTNDFEGRHQRLVNKEELLELIDEVKISPAVRTMPEVLSRQFDVLNNSNAKAKRSYLLSDFQRSLVNFEKVKNDTSIEIHGIPLLAKEKKNVYIDSCWFTSPVRQLNATEQLHVRIRNITSEDKENNPIKLFINGKQRTPASYNVEANGETDVLLSFASKETGIQQCMIEINDYPVSFDDRFYFSFEVAKNIPVLAINAGQAGGAMALSTQNSAVTSLFGNDSLFLFKNAPENNLDYSTLGQNRFIVLNELKTVSSGLAQELKRFVEGGGSIAVFPGKEIDLSSYREFLGAMSVNAYEKLDTVNTKVDRINYEHELFTDVFEKKNDNIDLPNVSAHYPIAKLSRSNEEQVFRMRNGDVFLGAYRYGKGKIYLSAVPLDNEFSNFSKHALTITALYNMAIYSQTVRPLFYTIGRDNAVTIPTAAVTGENVYHIKGTGNFDVIPEHKVTGAGTDIFIHDQVTQAGSYTLTQGNETLAGLAFNYDRKESDLNTYEPAELLSRAESSGMSNFTLVEPGHKELTATLAELDQGKKLWKLCLILALVFLAAEVVLLRLWR
jgi:hypothetical protein